MSSLRAELILGNAPESDAAILRKILLENGYSAADGSVYQLNDGRLAVMFASNFDPQDKEIVYYLFVRELEGQKFSNIKVGAEFKSGQDRFIKVKTFLAPAHGDINAVCLTGSCAGTWAYFSDSVLVRVIEN